MSDDADVTRLIERAKLAEQAECYDDMAEFMKRAVDLQFDSKTPLYTEQRNLLSVAYKNIVGSKRSAWRIISSIAEKQAEKGEVSMKLETDDYLASIEDRLTKTCKEYLALIETKLIPLADHSAEAGVFYHKMKGDYLRYLTEVTKPPADRKAFAERAADAYGMADEIALSDLKPTNPIRLGLALNFSVFHYEIQNDPKKACELAKDAFDAAIRELDSLPEDSYKDSTLIMQLLRDNLTLWTSESEEDKPKD